MQEPTEQLEQLYRELYHVILLYLRRQVGSAHIAEELLQETFLIAARDVESLQAARSKRAWMIGIARNLSREHHRQEARHRHFSIQEDLATSRPEKEDPRLEAMRDAIDRLPAVQREVLKLRLNEDLTYSEIAEMLEIPIGTVRSRIHHAIMRLRMKMAPATIGSNTDSPGPPK